MSSIKKVLIIKVVLAAVCIAAGLISFFVLAGIFSNVDFYADTISALDKSRSKVMELAAAAVASSSAITLLPLTVTGMVAFKYIIPVACLLFIIFIASNEKVFAKIATKLFLFSLVISFTIPISVNIANMIESNYASSIDTTLNNAKQNTQTVTDDAKEESGNAIDKFVNNITGNANEILKKFENTVSSFIEAIAVMIVTSCLIPIGVLFFFLWLVKLIFSINVNGFNFMRRENR